MLAEKEKNNIREILLELKSELSKFIDGSKESAKPVDLDKPTGRLTRMDEIQQQNMVKGTIEASKKRLQAVENALARISEDTFGECFECGDEIPFERLKVRPESTLCLECKEDLEN